MALGIPGCALCPGVSRRSRSEEALTGGWPPGAIPAVLHSVRVPPPTLSDLYRYPVKSCRGERLTAGTVEPWGLAGDRRWMIVDADGGPVTAREYPQLVLVSPRRSGDAIRLTRRPHRTWSCRSRSAMSWCR